MPTSVTTGTLIFVGLVLAAAIVVIIIIASVIGSFTKKSSFLSKYCGFPDWNDPSIFDTDPASDRALEINGKLEAKAAADLAEAKARANANSDK